MISVDYEFRWLSKADNEFTVITNEYPHFETLTHERTYCHGDVEIYVYK